MPRPVWRQLLLIVVVPLLCGLALAWGSDWDRQYVWLAVMTIAGGSAVQWKRFKDDTSRATACPR